MSNDNYYIYILTNINRSVLYIGVTNSIERRIQEHKSDALGERKTFAGKYNCYHLIHLEHFQYINHAISREKELKGWTRVKKDNLINSVNP